MKNLLKNNVIVWVIAIAISGSSKPTFGTGLISDLISVLAIFSAIVITVNNTKEKRKEGAQKKEGGETSKEGK